MRRNLLYFIVPYAKISVSGYLYRLYDDGQGSNRIACVVGVPVAYNGVVLVNFHVLNAQRGSFCDGCREVSERLSFDELTEYAVACGAGGGVGLYGEHARGAVFEVVVEDGAVGIAVLIEVDDVVGFELLIGIIHSECAETARELAVLDDVGIAHFAYDGGKLADVVVFDIVGVNRWRERARIEQIEVGRFLGICLEVFAHGAFAVLVVRFVVAFVAFGIVGIAAAVQVAGRIAVDYGAVVEAGIGKFYKVPYRLGIHVAVELVLELVVVSVIGYGDDCLGMV